jgi:3-isopropylmalate/(R)-2-methylmalate dehydratase small subunit
MSEDPRRIRIAGKGIAVRGNDIDTDRIIPARFLRTVTFEGLGEHAFEDDRAALKRAGRVHPFDDAKFADAEILCVNKNFGCGSSREHAPQAILRWGRGIKAVVGESFAEIFHGNCIQLGIPCPVLSSTDMKQLMALVDAQPSMPLSVDLETKTLTAGDQKWSFEMPESARQQFLSGRWDSMSELLENTDQIRERMHGLPYFNGFSGA